MTRRHRGASRLRFLASGGAFVAASMGLTACPPTTTAPLVSAHTVNPCLTDAAIACDSVGTHIASMPQATPRHQLVVLINGTGASPQKYQKMINELAGAGFHVAAVRYQSSVGTKEACPDAIVPANPQCHRAFRSEVTYGENVADPSGQAYDSPFISVPASESFTNRLLKLLGYLATKYPAEGWGQYLDTTDGQCNHVVDPYESCDLRWSDVALVGHSNGSGVALYLSKFQSVARLAMISGPFDEYRVGSTTVVAPWIAEGGFATDRTRMFGFTHKTEPNAVAQSLAWDALGLPRPQASVDNPAQPFVGAQQLTTNLVPACELDPNGKHNSTAQDDCTPGTPPTFSAVWRYLAGWTATPPATTTTTTTSVTTTEAPPTSVPCPDPEHPELPC